MANILYTAVTGMTAKEHQISIIANNISNGSTIGYKKYTPLFETLLYEQINQSGANSTSDGGTIPAGLQIGQGVNLVADYRAHTQGEFKITNNELDLAINGRGFFRVILPNGEFAYTRAGKFSLSADGEIVGPHGEVLSPTISVPSNTNKIEINQSGEVFAFFHNIVQPTNLGQIEIALFVNPAGLTDIGQNLYVESSASGTPIDGVAGEENFGLILQGALEMSNVNPLEEISDMIIAQRGYELDSQVLQAGDEMYKTLVNAKK